MAQISTGSSRANATITYADFKGCDFSKDASQVDRRRSPDGLNMVSDNGNNPVKRRGWETFQRTSRGTAVKNVWTYTDARGEILVWHDAKYLYLRTKGKVEMHTLDKMPTLLQPICAMPVENGLIVFSGRTLIMCQTVKTSGSYFTELGQGSIADVGDTGTTKFTPYVPTILFGKKADGSEGVTLEPVNLLTRQVKETFFPDGTSKSFVVSLPIDTTKKVSVKNVVTGKYLKATVKNKTVTLSTAVTKNDNDPTIEITYSAKGGSTNVEKIANAKWCACVTEGTGFRYFIAQGDTNRIRYSELNDITYFPDTNYIQVGNDDSKIVGFLPLDDSLAVLKQGSENQPTVFYLSQTMLTDTTQTVDSSGDVKTTTTGRYVYKITQSGALVGAISRLTLAVLGDEPLFLSKQGVQAIASKNVNSEKVVRRRSMYLDGKLMAEKNLDKACAVVHNGYYILVVNSHAYVLDGRQKTQDYSGNTTYNYEGYYWENIPATCMASDGDTLYFGTADGRICRFKNSGQIEDYSDDGKPIHAIWSTCDDYDGKPQYLKTMQKKGSNISLKTYTRSSVTVTAQADGGAIQLIGETELSYSGLFKTVDFSNLSFDTQTGARDTSLKKKVKKYHRLKLIAENNKANEGFGIYSITKTYYTAKYTK